MWTCSYCEMVNPDTDANCRFCRNPRAVDAPGPVLGVPPVPPPVQPGRPYQQPPKHPPVQPGRQPQAVRPQQGGQQGQQVRRQPVPPAQPQAAPQPPRYNQAGKRTKEMAEEAAPVFPAGLGTDATVYEPVKPAEAPAPAAAAAAPAPAPAPAKAPAPVAASPKLPPAAESKPSDILKTIPKESSVNDAVSAKRKRLRIGLIAANAALLVVNIIGIIMIVK